MKILKIVYFVVVAAVFASVPGCKEDNEEVISGFVGNFVISHAAVAVSFTLYTAEGPEIPVPVGMDITPAIQAALLSQVDCSSADKTYIELREDNSIYMSCEGQNELNAGTWEEVSATELKLNLNNAAVPSAPSGVVLNVSEIVKDASGWSGKTSVPLPKAMFAAGLQAYGFTIAETPAMYMVTFSLDFVKK